MEWRKGWLRGWLVMVLRPVMHGEWREKIHLESRNVSAVRDMGLMLMAHSKGF